MRDGKPRGFVFVRFHLLGELQRALRHRGELAVKRRKVFLEMANRRSKNRHGGRSLGQQK